tara:strand:- start:15 stop:791 length:777 start_codon:yes stop_codon:yes gene_type:complete
MYKILKNLIPKQTCLDCQEDLILKSKNKEVEEKIAENKKILLKKLSHNEIIEIDNVNKMIFNEKLIEKIKENIGDFYFINNIAATINGFSSVPHRDGQSFGFNYEGIKKSSKIFKILFYFNGNNQKIDKGLDVNFFDINLKNIFYNKKLYMKLNFYYEYYFRKKIMKTLRLNLGDVIIMDSNTWHRATPQNNLNSEDGKFKCHKILLDFEVVTEENLALEYATHVRRSFLEEKNIPNNLTNNIFNEHLNKAGIKTINV